MDSERRLFRRRFYDPQRRRPRQPPRRAGPSRQDRRTGAHEMTEIKPDTSLYDDMPNKLRAFAEILATSRQIQCNTTAAPNNLQWSDSNTPLADKLEFLVSGVDYRAK